MNVGVELVDDDSEAEDPGGLDRLHEYVNAGLEKHVDEGFAASVTSSPLRTGSPAYEAPLTSEMDGLLDGGEHVASSVVCAKPLWPDFCPVATSWTTYVPEPPGVNVGDGAFASLKLPPLGPDTTDHAYESV